jgi:hypothetical protein
MLLLHIGRGKAGSTTIQHSLLANEALLREHGIIQPAASKQHGGNYMSLAPALKSSSIGSSPALDEFSRMLARFPDHKIVASSEFLFGLQPSAIRTLRELSRGHDVQILVYIREYPRWFQSKYAQATRTGKNVADFDLYFDRRSKRVSALQHLSKWADVFGWENMRVRSLDPASLTGETLLADFSSVLGVTLRAELVRNVTPHWIEIEFLREIHNVNRDLRRKPRADRDLRRVCAQLRECLGAVATTQAEYLTPSQWSFLAELYAQDVFAISQRTGVAIPVPSGGGPVERPFLPSLSQAPKSVCDCFYERMKSAFWANRDPEIRDAVAAVLPAWSVSPARRYLSREKPTGLASL